MDSDKFETPPIASSTLVKSKRKKSNLKKLASHPINNMISENIPVRDNSSSILSSNNLESTSESQRRLEQYNLGSNLLKQSTALPAHYFNKNFASTPTLANGTSSESTVNESDLLKQFLPTDVSTPRTSSVSDIVASLGEFREQLLESSDMSLSKLCGRFSKVSTDLGVDNESFVSGDVAVAKMAQHEQSWFKERCVVGSASVRGDSLFSQFETGGDMTDFFKKKSELADLFLKDSPEKDTTPTPLLDQVEDKRESVLSYTAFENADTTAKIYELLRKAGDKENIFHANESVETKSRPTSSMNVVLRDASNVCEKSLSSIRTVSSLDHLTGGKLPIEINRTELVWGCTQLGKTSSQIFIIRNKSYNKVHFKITSSNVCFRIYTDQGDSEPVTVLAVLLYPAETRCFKVVFSPATMGAFIERLCFIPSSDELKAQQTKRQTLMLYGYGGNAHIDILNVAKDSNMRMWLSLGKFDNQIDLIKKFTVRNMGSLSAFVYLTFASKVLFDYSNVIIDPAKLIVPPKSQAVVTITFVPKKSDIRHILITASDQVIELGSVQIISGAEPLRGRIRNLGKKLVKDCGEITNQLVVTLSQIFPNENIPRDTQKFTETVGALIELTRNLYKKEITLTIERDMDTTVIGPLAGIDDTSFQSFAEGMITIVPNKAGASNSCTVEPLSLVLTPPIKVSDHILLISHHSASMQYETSVSPDDLLHVSPAEGILQPNDTIVINIACNVAKFKECQQQNQLQQILIYVDNEVFQVSVKIIFLKSS